MKISNFLSKIDLLLAPLYFRAYNAIKNGDVEKFKSTISLFDDILIKNKNQSISLTLDIISKMSSSSIDDESVNKYKDMLYILFDKDKNYIYETSRKYLSSLCVGKHFDVIVKLSNKCTLSVLDATYCAIMMNSSLFDYNIKENKDISSYFSKNDYLSFLKEQKSRLDMELSLAQILSLRANKKDTFPITNRAIKENANQITLWGQSLVCAPSHIIEFLFTEKYQSTPPRSGYSISLFSRKDPIDPYLMKKFIESGINFKKEFEKIAEDLSINDDEFIYIIKSTSPSFHKSYTEALKIIKSQEDKKAIQNALLSNKSSKDLKDANESIIKQDKSKTNNNQDLAGKGGEIDESSSIQSVKEKSIETIEKKEKSEKDKKISNEKALKMGERKRKI